MKKSVILSLLIMSIFFSCQKQKIAVLQGKIIMPAEESLMLKNTEDEEAIADTVVIDKDGNYSFSLKLDKPTFYQLRVSSDLILDVFLTPGDELTLNIDMTKPYDQIKFTGTGEKLNNFMLERFMADKYQMPPKMYLFRLPEGAFSRTMDSMLDARRKDLQDFTSSLQKELKSSAQKKSLEYFKKIYETNLLFDYASTFLVYRNNYGYLIQQPDYTFSPEFDNYLKNVDLNDENNISSKSFRRFISRYISSLVDPAYEKDTIAQQSETGYSTMRYQKAAEILKPGKAREFALYEIMLEQVNYYGVKNIDKLMSMFRKDCHNQNYLKSIEEKIKLWDKIAPGKDAPVFSYPDENGKMYSLADFKGKLVYLDVWATWCGPCVVEIPHFEILAKEYTGKNIIFLQISVDDNENEWRNFNKIMADNVIQLYAGGWQSKIADDYLIKSIPRFILIDQDGKIIDNNASRPSDLKTRALINEHLSTIN